MFLVNISTSNKMSLPVSCIYWQNTKRVQAKHVDCWDEHCSLLLRNEQCSLSTASWAAIFPALWRWKRFSNRVSLLEQQCWSQIAAFCYLLIMKIGETLTLVSLSLSRCKHLFCFTFSIKTQTISFLIERPTWWTVSLLYCGWCCLMQAATLSTFGRCFWYWKFKFV